MRPDHLTNFETQKYYQNKPKFNSVYSNKHLAKIKDEAYIISIHEYKLVETHWVALYKNGDHLTCFYISFGVDHIPKKI